MYVVDSFMLLICECTWSATATLLLSGSPKDDRIELIQKSGHYKGIASIYQTE